MTNKILFAALLLLAGCISRQTYLRDRLQDSQDKQEQRKFNAEVLRKLDDNQQSDRIGQQAGEIIDIWDRLAALEKKMDDRQEPEDNPMLEVTIGTHVFHMRYDELEKQIQNRRKP